MVRRVFEASRMHQARRSTRMIQPQCLIPRVPYRLVGEVAVGDDKVFADEVKHLPIRRPLSLALVLRAPELGPVPLRQPAHVQPCGLGQPSSLLIMRPSLPPCLFADSDV